MRVLGPSEHPRDARASKASSARPRDSRPARPRLGSTAERSKPQGPRPRQPAQETQEQRARTRVLRWSPAESRSGRAGEDGALRRRAAAAVGSSSRPPCRRRAGLGGLVSTPPPRACAARRARRAGLGSPAPTAGLRPAPADLSQSGRQRSGARSHQDAVQRPRQQATTESLLALWWVFYKPFPRELDVKFKTLVFRLLQN